MDLPGSESAKAMSTAAVKYPKGVLPVLHGSQAGRSQASIMSRKRSLIRICVMIAPIIAMSGVLLGLLEILGYAVDWDWLRRPIGEHASLHPMSAVAIILVGLAICLAHPFKPSRFCLAFAIAAAIIGLYRLGSAITGPWIEPDLLTILFGPTLKQAALARHPIIMATQTAATIILLSCSSVLLYAKRFLASQIVAILATIMPSVALVGYLYGELDFVGQMSLPAALALLLCAWAMLCRTAFKAPLRLLLSSHPAGGLARSQMLILCGLLVFVGIVSSRMGPVLGEQTKPLRTMFMIMSCIVVVSAGIQRFERSDRRRRLAERQALSATTLDPLTGIMNRRSFLDRGDAIIRNIANDGHDIGLLTIDLDRLKSINDHLGQAAGDEVLRRLSRIIVETVRSTDVIGRIGGDEFAVLMPGANGVVLNAIGEVVRRAVAAADVNDITAGMGSVTISIGAVSAPSDTTSLYDVIARAKAALDRAKAEGRNRVRLYEGYMATEVGENPAMEADLRGASERGEIFAVYQPQVDLLGSGIAGFEALARWRHPRHGLISPQRFIPLAESTGLIKTIGARILEVACREAREWQSDALAGATVSVNVSAIQLNDPEFVELVAQTLWATGLEPTRLILEVTESVMIKGGDYGIQSLRKLAELGVRVAIDDFGTGYSSLSYLRELPRNFLKIDQSFVRDLPDNEEAVAIARAIVGMGKSLGMRIVAEGVETRDQIDLLQSIWCDEGQGYYYSPPLESSELEAWANAWVSTVNNRTDTVTTAGLDAHG